MKGKFPFHKWNKTRKALRLNIGSNGKHEAYSNWEASYSHQGCAKMPQPHAIVWSAPTAKKTSKLVCSSNNLRKIWRMGWMQLEAISPRGKHSCSCKGWRSLQQHSYRGQHDKYCRHDNIPCKQLLPLTIRAILDSDGNRTVVCWGRPLTWCIAGPAVLTILSP